MGPLHTLAWSIAMFGLLSMFNHVYGQNLQLKVKTINRCPGLQYSKLAVGFEKLTFSMKPDSGNIMLNAMVIFRREISNSLMMVELSRCLSEDTNSCQKFVTLNCTSLCDEIYKKDKIWSTVAESIKGLPKSCPVPKGSYPMEDAYIDLDKAQETLNLPAGNWLVNLNIYEDSELLTCYYIIATVKPVRRRKFPL